jgi:hypothetical protein
MLRLRMMSDRKDPAKDISSPRWTYQRRRSAFVAVLGVAEMSVIV